MGSSRAKCKLQHQVSGAGGNWVHREVKLLPPEPLILSSFSRHAKRNLSQSQAKKKKKHEKQQLYPNSGRSYPGLKSCIREQLHPALLELWQPFQEQEIEIKYPPPFINKLPFPQQIHPHECPLSIQSAHGLPRPKFQSIGAGGVGGGVLPTLGGVLGKVASGGALFPFRQN